MSQQRKIKTTYVGMTVSGLRDKVALVQDEGLQEAKRYIGTLNRNKDDFEGEVLGINF